MAKACEELLSLSGALSPALARNATLHLATFFHRGYLTLAAFTRLSRRLAELTAQ